MRQSGFTLVELAIALMVIGLLIGGVLKGQELIENAKLTATIRQMNAYDTAAMIFRNTYNALPGDIKRPNRIPNCDEEICNLGGNGNGKVHHHDTTPRRIEESNFFLHLTKAGMIQGPAGGTRSEFDEISTLGSDNMDWEIHEKFFPTTQIGRFWGFDTGGPTHNVSAVYYIEMTVKEVSQLDTKIDDGKSNKGQISVEYCEGTNSIIDDEYNPQSTEECGVWWLAGF